jgi:hypothetical protein
MNFHQRLDLPTPRKMGRRLDINTPVGQRYKEAQARAEKLFYDISGFRVFKMDPDGSSCFDGFLEYQGVLKCGFEIKSRNDTLERLYQYGTLIVSYDKIEQSREVCRALNMPFIVILYSIPDHAIRYWKVSDHRGKLYHPYQTETKWTQATCNGGKKSDKVYLLPFELCSCVPVATL